MTRHSISQKEIGMVRIYMKPREKVPGKSGWLRGSLLYRELILQAKAAGILNAVAHSTHFGYSNGGRVADDGFEISNPDLTMCVELIGDRHELENFCRTHGGMLKGKVIIYKHIEHWDITGHGVIVEDVLKPSVP